MENPYKINFDEILNNAELSASGYKPANRKYQSKREIVAAHFKRQLPSNDVRDFLATKADNYKQDVLIPELELWHNDGLTEIEAEQVKEIVAGIDYKKLMAKYAKKT